MKLRFPCVRRIYWVIIQFTLYEKVESLHQYAISPFGYCISREEARAKVCCSIFHSESRHFVWCLCRQFILIFPDLFQDLFIVQTKTQPQMQNSLEYFILGYRLCNRSPFSSSRSSVCSASDFIFQHRVVHCYAWLHLWESKHCGPCMCIMYYLGVRTLRLINAFEKCQRFLNGDKLVAFETSSLLLILLLGVLHIFGNFICWII